MKSADSKTALLLALSPKGEGPAKGDEAPEEDSGAEDILDAIKSRDPAALKMALRAFVSDCMASYDKEDSDES